LREDLEKKNTIITWIPFLQKKKPGFQPSFHYLLCWLMGWSYLFDVVCHIQGRHARMCPVECRSGTGSESSPPLSTALRPCLQSCWVAAHRSHRLPAACRPPRSTPRRCGERPRPGGQGLPVPVGREGLYRDQAGVVAVDDDGDQVADGKRRTRTDPEGGGRYIKFKYRPPLGAISTAGLNLTG
jgi:hypothetical protein